MSGGPTSGAEPRGGRPSRPGPGATRWDGLSGRDGEIESVEELAALLEEHRTGEPHGRGLDGVVVQAVDLSGLDRPLRSAPVAGAIFLGCRCPADLAQSLRARGALMFPPLPDVPFDLYRPRLYRAEELYDRLDEGYDRTLDARVYAWTRTRCRPPVLRDNLACALHDDAMTDGLDDLLADVDDERRVGVMGGHALVRGEPGYRRAADLGARLAEAGHLVITGGGPGAMEAANLGATCPAGHLAEALDLLAAAPSFSRDVTGWARCAQQVRRSWPEGPAHPSVGIPTWFYGHEPPNPFATHVAKYFSNALREDVLLDRCRGGLVYLPGAAGTLQELFQAFTGNYYATDESDITPLVLLGREHWSTTLPAWGLLEVASGSRPVSRHVHLVDTVEEAIDALASSVAR